MDNVHDVVIIGGGPAGLTAGIYCARARMNVILLERTMCGGQVLLTDTIENFPGFPDGIKGQELAEWMQKQAEHLNLRIETGEAREVLSGKSPGGIFTIKTDKASSIQALSVIVSTGAKWNKLGIPGEDEYSARGVSYCATCDGPLFRGKDVVVVGGGNTAIEDALFLTKFANKVMVVHRRDKLRATKILQERAFANKKIEFHLESIAFEIHGRNTVTGIKIKNTRTNAEKELKCDGIFVLIGVTPNSEVIKGLVKLDEGGYVITDDDMRASVQGIFACGDVRKKALRQIVTAAGDGATAAFSAERYVDSVKGTEYNK